VIFKSRCEVVSWCIVAKKIYITYYYYYYLYSLGFGAFDSYKLDRIWAIMYDNLRSILKNRGGNDYKPEHTGKRERQKSAGTAVDLTVPMEDYHECVRLVREYRRAHPLE